MSENKADIVAYRLAKADEDLHDATLLANMGGKSGAVNRLYYGAFHAISALLHQRDISFNPHTGAKSMFELHVVKTGEVDRRWPKFYTRLLESCNESDYDDFAIFTADDVLPLLPQTAEFIELIKSLIETPTPS